MHAHAAAPTQRACPHNPIRQACAAAGGSGYAPRLTLLVVSKSHGTRLLAATGPGDLDVANPAPGTVLDHTITRWGARRADGGRARSLPRGKHGPRQAGQGYVSVGRNPYAGAWHR